jgi:hypothetical protein
MRATMKMPAVTMVAAWMSAEIGVGPSMESGSQTCSGTCADLPMAPMNSRMQVRVIADQAAPGKISTVRAGQRRGALEHGGVVEAAEPEQHAPMPSRKPKSPTRFTRKAFMFACTALGFLNQKPISR